MDIREQVNDIIDLSNAKEAFQSITDHVDESLRMLFGKLDVNRDGVLQYEEFQGITLNVWAELNRIIEISYGERLSDLQVLIAEHFGFPSHQSTSWISIFFSYLMILFYVQMGLCLFDKFLNFLYWIRVLKRPWEFPKNPVPPVRVSKKEALRYDTPLTGWYELSKTFIMVISGLAIFRLVFGIFFFVLSASSVSASSWYPSPLWRRIFLALGGFFARTFMFFLGFYTIRRHGKIAPKSDVKLIISNHIGIFEIVLLFVSCYPSFVSRAENASIPLFRGIIQACDAILVNREDQDSKKKTLEEIMHRSKDPASPQLMVYPEGTTNNQRAMFLFKKGVFATAQPVQPVLFRFHYKFFNPCYTGRLVGGNDAIDLIARTACQFVNYAEFKCLDVYHPSKAEVENPLLYAENMQKYMASHLGIPISDATYDDYKEVLDKFYAKQEQAQTQEPGGWSSKQRSRTWSKVSVSEEFSQSNNSTTNNNNISDNGSKKDD